MAGVLNILFLKTTTSDIYIQWKEHITYLITMYMIKRRKAVKTFSFEYNLIKFLCKMSWQSELTIPFSMINWHLLLDLVSLKAIFICDKHITILPIPQTCAKLKPLRT